MAPEPADVGGRHVGGQKPPDFIPDRTAYEAAAAREDLPSKPSLR
jgi:hypothetical protein